MPGPTLKAPRLHYLGTITGLSIYLVDGEKIRNELDVDFVFGGNEAVYPNYVPKNEIWIDDATSPLDRTATLLHEIVERNLMVSKGWSYDKAHDAASAAEKPFRRELKKKPPRTTDIRRVTEALARLEPSKSQATSASNKVEREYPKVAAVGRRRTAAQLDREINAALTRRR